MAPRRPALLSLRAAPALAVLSMGLLHCGGQGLSIRDGGDESDATVEGGRAGDAAADAQSPSCGEIGSPCVLDAGVPTCDGGSGWRCAVDTSCSSPTTLTGKVFDPAGVTPLDNVVVFIPNVASALPALVPGTSACACGISIGDYVAATTTGSTGAFAMQGVPTGNGVPITVQTGKWRRTVYVDITGKCGTNVVPDGMLRLPRRRSEGDLPQLAIVTGGFDDLGCFLRRVGVDPSEYSEPHGGGRLDVYRGVAASSGAMTGTGPGLSSGTAGDCTTASCPLWSSKSALEYYDTVLLSCEGDPYTASKPASAIQAMHDWLNEGGKLLATHSQSVWFQSGPSDFQGVAAWKDFSTALDSGAYSIDTTFQKGFIFGGWLDAVGAATGASISLSAVADTVGSSSAAAAAQWIYDPSSADAAADAASTRDVKLLSFATPVGGIPPALLDAGTAFALEYCGKAVFSDVHAGAAPAGDLPDACQTGPMTAGEKALEFMFFDQPLCVYQPSGKGVPPPPGP